MIAAVVAAVALSLPGTFHEAKPLEPAASYAAQRPVKVFCARTDLDLREYRQEAYGGDIGAEIGLAIYADSTMLLGQSVCDPLLAQLSKRHDGGALLGGALLVLVHESVHLRGIHDEGVTECTAVHTVPGVAVRFFRIRPGRQLRALMSDVWAVHNDEAPTYLAVC